MEINRIEQVVIETLTDYCNSHNIDVKIEKNTPLIGTNSVLDSIGLVNFIVDVETAFLDYDVDVSLTSESAMSTKISPFRSVSSVVNFISKQLEKSNE